MASDVLGAVTGRDSVARKKGPSFWLIVPKGRTALVDMALTGPLRIVDAPDAQPRRALREGTAVSQLKTEVTGRC